VRSGRLMHMASRTRTFLGVLATVASVSVFAACGSSSKAAAPASSVVGHSYHSTKVTGHTLPAGTHVTLSFGTDGKLSANAGCNTMGGNYVVSGGRLIVGQMSGTLMGCIPATRQAQDHWISELLGGRPQIEQTGTALRLTSGPTVIDLAEG
jgi:heat shock protein HslJ